MSRALMSTPPDIVRPEFVVPRLWARASRVRLSSRTKTWPPPSAIRLARSIVSWARRICSSVVWSDDDAITSPWTVRRISVTSSGRSSTSRTRRYISGWFFAIEAAICWSRIVLPVRGGATISPRWPLPIGVSRSMTRMPSGSGPTSRRIRSWGSIGVRSSKPGQLDVLVGRPALDLDQVEELRRVLSGRLVDDARELDPLLELELREQGRADDDVAGVRLEVPLGVAEEAMSLRMHLQHAGAGRCGRAHGKARLVGVARAKGPGVRAESRSGVKWENVGKRPTAMGPGGSIREADRRQALKSV